MESARLLAAASVHELLQRQDAVTREHTRHATRIRDSHDHVQRTLERYVQDLVCQLEELSIAIPPRLSGAVDASTPDALRSVLQEHIERLRRELDDLNRAGAGAAAATSHAPTASSAFGSIQTYVQDLHALKQQSHALQERKAELQHRLDAQHRARAAAAASAAGSAPPLSRFESLTVNTVASPLDSAASVSGSSAQDAAATSAAATSGGSTANDADTFGPRSGSSEVARCALEPQRETAVVFDSPRLDSRARSLFSPTTEDAGKSAGFGATGSSASWGDDGAGEATHASDGASAWGAFPSPTSAFTSDDAFGDFAAAPAWSSSDAEPFSSASGTVLETARPLSPSLLVFSPTGSDAPATATSASSGTGSRFFGHESNDSSTAKSIMELYPAPAAVRRPAPAAFDVFALDFDASFSALDAGNDMDLNVFEAAPGDFVAAPPARDDAVLESDVRERAAASSFDKTTAPLAAPSYSTIASPRSTPRRTDEAKASAVEPPVSSMADTPAAFEFASFEDSASSQQQQSAWDGADSTSSGFGAFGDWGASESSGAAVDASASVGAFGAFESGEVAPETSVSVSAPSNDAAFGDFAAFEGDFSVSASAASNDVAFGNFAAFQGDFHVSASAASNDVAFGNFEATFETGTVDDQEAKTTASSSATVAVDESASVSASASTEFGSFEFASETTVVAGGVGGDDDAAAFASEASRVSSFTATETVGSAAAEESASTSDGGVAFGSFESFDAQAIAAAAVAVDESASTSVSASASTEFGSFEFASETTVVAGGVGGSVSDGLGDDEFERMLEGAAVGGALPDDSDFDFDAALAQDSSTMVNVKSASHLADEVDELLGGAVEDTSGKTYTLDEVDSEIETLFSPTSAAQGQPSAGS